MNRTLVVPAVAFAALTLAACGGGNSSDSASETTAGTTGTAETSSSGTTSSNSGEKTVVKVDGKDLTGIDLSKVGCTRQGDTLVIGSGGSGGGVGAILGTGNPPKVQTVGLTVDGQALAVGGGVGDAEVKVDGDRYTITGNAQGADLSNISQGLQKKSFEISVTCNK